VCVFEDWIVELGQRSVEGLDRPTLCDEAAAIARLRAATDAYEARVLFAVDRLGDKGAPASTVVRSASRCSQREADRKARRASTLAQVPSAAEALAAGRLSVEHVDSLTRAAEATSPEAVESSRLVDVACRRPADLHAKDAREWTRRRQTDADLEAAHRRRVTARRLSIFDNDDGMTVLHGEFDPATGAQLRRAITVETDRLFQADGGRGAAGDVRTPEQRRADALAGLLVGERGGADAGSTAPVRNQLLLMVTADDGGVPGGHLADGKPLPVSAVERLACGSDLFAVVLSQDGDPLWLGRKVRLATDGQWRALVARDGGCRVCAADPSKCEAHHILAWQPPGNGPTDITNLILLCSHHHHLVHDLGWWLVAVEDGGWELRPP
jgi:hypothetical protein